MFVFFSCNVEPSRSPTRLLRSQVGWPTMVHGASNQATYVEVRWDPIYFFH